MGLALLLLLIVFAGLARHVSAMTLGEPTGASPGHDAQPDEPGSPPDPALPAPGAAAEPGARGRQAPLLLALGAATVLGFLAVPLAAALSEAAAVLAGAR
jgi:hypothetical protein